MGELGKGSQSQRSWPRLMDGITRRGLIGGGVVSPRWRRSVV